MRVAFTVFISFILNSITLCQIIKVNDVQHFPMDIAARENRILDANGDGCALVKTRIGIDSLKFISDLGINKIEKHSGEYWLWVPAGTRNIGIISSTEDTISFVLPAHATEYNVYVAFLTAVLPDEIVYRNFPVVSIETIPDNSDIFINSIYQGQSPLKINIPPDSFMIRIEKKRYTTLFHPDSTGFSSKNYNFKLEKDPFANRPYVSMMSSILNPGKPNIGLNIGILGKPGFYISVLFPVDKIKKYEGVDFDLDNFNYPSYFLVSPDNAATIIEFSEVIFGINNPLNKSIYFSAGVGYVQSYSFIRCEKYYYTQPDLPFDSFWAKINEKNVRIGIGLDLGLSVRLANKFILYLNNTMVFDTDNKKINYLISNLKAGMGYNF